MLAGRVLAIVAIGTATLCADETEELPYVSLLRPLTQRGVLFPEGHYQKLAPPSMQDGWDTQTQRKEVTKLAGRHGWEAFVRDSAVAPFTLELAYIRDGDGNRIGHVVDLWFVAHGTLASLENERLADGLFEEGDGSPDADRPQIRVLDQEELARVGIAELNGDSEKYIFAEFPLLHRVQARGVAHVRRCVGDDSLVVAWELVPRFRDAESVTNSWHSIDADSLGNRSVGELRPYEGYGGYIKVTRLAEPAGALWIEAHVVFHEPEGWFRGSNALRSKMPLAIQDSVRAFRRQLKRLGTAAAQ